MANDKMRVVFNKEDIKQILIGVLSKAEMKIKDTDVDIVVIELPDNSANIGTSSQKEVNGR